MTASYADYETHGVHSDKPRAADRSDVPPSLLIGLTVCSPAFENQAAVSRFRIGRKDEAAAPSIRRELPFGFDSSY